jgi:DNA-binding MarR family transcriptional regulator
MGVEKTASALRAIALGLGPVARECRVSGLTREHMDVVSFLRGEHKASVSTLAKKLGTGLKTMTRALSALERREVVVRSRSVDGHGVFFGLTDLGRKVAAEDAARWQTVYAELLEPLPVKDQLRVGEAMAMLGDLLKTHFK